MPNQKPSSIIVAAGPRDAEERLLRFVGELSSGGLTGLDRPIRIVVPSRSLRRHVLRVLVQRFGTVLGVLVQTHRALALEVLERAGLEAPVGGAHVQDLLVRVLAAREDILHRELGRFDDGAATVVAAVRDLIDAGFTPAHLEPVAEAVAAARLQEGDRAQALLRVAAACQEMLDEHLWAHRSTVHVLAREVLLARGSDVLPSRAVVIYGFAETTGLLADLFETLVASFGATVVLDQPPDPARCDQRDPGWVFTARLADRLAGPGSAGRLQWAASAEHPVALDAFAAPGAEAEVREIAAQIRSVRGQGTPWESIGVVFRRLDPLTVDAVRRHFTRLGIPFSGEGATARGGQPARRAAALADLLSQGSAARTEVWLGCLSWGSHALRFEIDLALRAAGASRLGDVAGLDEPTADLNLPLVERLEEVDSRVRRRYRVLPAPRLAEIVRSARRLVAVLDGRPDEVQVGDLLGWVHQVLSALGPHADDEVDPALEAVNALADDLPEELVVGWHDLAPLLNRELDRIGRQPMGGEGGGVQILSVMEARGRTFDHLFLAGMTRGVFPAQPIEDPVLSTAARRAIPTDVLPDMPLKGRDSEEERYLFAQLMAAAPSITLSWQRVDAGGKESNPSVFLERLRLAGVVCWPRGQDETPATKTGRFRQAPDLFGERRPGDVRPALEHAVVAGLQGRSSSYGPSMSELSAPRADHLLAALEELDPSNPRHGLGPFLGLVGLRPPAATSVTRLEQMAVCPWQTFLERELGLQPPPEASFAEEGLAGRVAGVVVHEVLEAIATTQGVPAGRELEVVVEGPGFSVAWPDETTFERIVSGTADRVARDEGVPALTEAIVAYVRPLLDRARALVWPRGSSTVLGVETSGRHRLSWTDRDGETRELELRFRADMVGRADDGGNLLLVDYKSGAVTNLSQPTALPRGKLLQGAVYVLSAGEEAIGRYVTVADPKNLARGPVVDIDRTLARHLEPCAGIILGSWDEGVWFPRLSTPNGNAVGPACGWCRVKAACLLGEPGVKGRLIEAFESMSGASALRQMWYLPVRKAEEPA